MSDETLRASGAPKKITKRTVKNIIGFTGVAMLAIPSVAAVVAIAVSALAEVPTPVLIGLGYFLIAGLLISFAGSMEG